MALPVLVIRFGGRLASQAIVQDYGQLSREGRPGLGAGHASIEPPVVFTQHGLCSLERHDRCFQGLRQSILDPFGFAAATSTGTDLVDWSQTQP